MEAPGRRDAETSVAFLGAIYHGPATELGLWPAAVLHPVSYRLRGSGRSSRNDKSRWRGRAGMYVLKLLGFRRTVADNIIIVVADHLWKLGFAREVLTSLIDQAFGAKPPAYNTIIMLDRVGEWSLARCPPSWSPCSLLGNAVRQYSVPSSLLINEADSTSIGLTMQRHAIQILKETCTQNAITCGANDADL